MSRRASFGSNGPEAEVTVEVKSLQLEQYLSSIKESLSKHEEDCKLVHILSRKLDLCMLDVDVIRDHFYRQKSQITEQKTISHGTTIEFLRAELEALRIVTRRIDLHQATDGMIFDQIKELQREVRMMKKDKESSGSVREKSEREKTKNKRDKKIAPIHNSIINPLKDETMEMELGTGASGPNGHQIESPFFDNHAKLSQMSFNSSLDALSTAANSTSEAAANIATEITATNGSGGLSRSVRKLNSNKEDSSKRSGRKEVTYADQYRPEFYNSDEDNDKENDSPNKSYSSKWKSRKISMLARNRRRNTTIVGDSDSEGSDDGNGPGYNSEFDELVRGMDKHQTAIASIEQHLVVLQKKQIADAMKDELAEIAKLEKHRLKKITKGAEVLSSYLKRITLKGVRLLFLRWNSKVVHKIAIVPKKSPISENSKIKTPPIPSKSLKVNDSEPLKVRDSEQEFYERKRKGRNSLVVEAIDWKEREKKSAKNSIDDKMTEMITSYQDKLFNIATSVTRVNWLAVILRPRFQRWKARTLMLREADYQDERKMELREIAEELKQAQMAKIHPIARGWFLLSYPELRQYFQRLRRCTVWSRLRIGDYIEGGGNQSLTEMSVYVFADLKDEEYQVSLIKFATMLMKLTDQPEIISDTNAHQLVLRMLFKTTSLRIEYADLISEEKQVSIKRLSLEQLDQRDKLQTLTNFIGRIDTKIAESRNAANVKFDEYKIDVSKLVENSVGNAAEILNFKQGAMLTKLRDMTTKLDFWSIQAQESEERLIRTEFKTEKLLFSYGEQLSQLVALENGHLEYMKERVIWNRDMKNVSLTANTTQEKFIEFNRWRIGYETTVKSEFNVLKGSCNKLTELIGHIDINDENKKELLKKLEGRTVILEQVLQVISPVVPSARELISICFEFENDILHLNKNLNIRNINVNMIIDMAVSEKITRFATRLALHIAATANLAALCVAVSEPPVQTGINNYNLTGSNTAEEVAARRDQLLHEFHSQFIIILKAESSSDPGISRCEARVVFYHRFISALELSMSIHAYMMVEIPSAIGRSNGNSNNTHLNTNNGTMYSTSYEINNVNGRPHSALSGMRQSQSDRLLSTVMSSSLKKDIVNKSDDVSSCCLTCDRPLKDKFGLNRRKEKPSFLSLPLLLSAFEEEMSVLSLRKENEMNDKLALQSIQKAKASRTAFLSDAWRQDSDLSNYVTNSEIVEDNMLSIRSIVGKESQVSFGNTSSESILAALSSSNDNEFNDERSNFIRRQSTGNHLRKSSGSPLLIDGSKSKSSSKLN